MRFYILFRTFFFFFFKSGMYVKLNSTFQFGPATFQVLKSHMWLVATTLTCAALSLGKFKKENRKIMCVRYKNLKGTPSNNQQKIPTP